MNVLIAQPVEVIPDAGPKHRAGAGTWLLALIASLVAGLFLAGWHGETDTSAATAMLVAAGVFSAPAAWCWWCIVKSVSGRGKTPPGSHFLLVEHLKFIITRTIGDTAVTAFLRPDSLAPGAATCLLIFLENYSSRRRHVKIRVGTCAALDLPRQSRIDLVVLAGQAVVYRWPLRIYPDAKPGDYDIRLRLSVKAVNGPGQLLRPFSGRKHKTANTFALTSASFQLNPGFSVASGAAVPAVPLVEPGFIALSSPAVSQPRFHLLRQISENSPAQPVVTDSPPSTPPWAQPAV